MNFILVYILGVPKMHQKQFYLLSALDGCIFHYSEMRNHLKNLKNVRGQSLVSSLSS